jgi:hypothetical protein
LRAVHLGDTTDVMANILMLAQMGDGYAPISFIHNGIMRKR